MLRIDINLIEFGDRGREDYKDLESLAASIKKYGLMHPVVLDKDLKLIAGGRRLSAAALLGWTSIPYTSMGALTPIQLQELELEENIAREDLTWAERCKMTEAIDKLKREINGDDWKREDTAVEIKRGKSSVATDIIMAEGLRDYPELKNEKLEKHAKTKLRRLRDAERRKKVVEFKQSKIEALHFGDALKILPTLEEHSIDLALLDPPYSMNVGNQRWAVESWGDINFEDNDEEENINLYEALAEEMARVLKDGGHCYIFFSMTMYPQVINAIAKHLNYNPAPLIWQKGSIGGNPDPFHRYTYNYEPVLFCWKGTTCREFNKSSFAVFQFNTVQGEKRGHPTEKPIDLYKYLIEMATIERDVVLDPTMGSGMALKAAKDLDRNIIGIEMNEDWYNLACVNVGGDDDA